MPKHIYPWPEIQKAHNAGQTFTECQQTFGFTHTAWVKAIRRGALHTADRPFPTDRRRRYDWAAIQRYYEEGHSYRECRERFGFNAMSWLKARRRGEIRTRPLGQPLDQLLASGKSRYNIKARLIRAGILDNRCGQCGISEWRGKPLKIHLDHINGIRDDNRIENLRMLCPNCHSQTETFAGLNIKRSRVV